MNCNLNFARVQEYCNSRKPGRRTAPIPPEFPVHSSRGPISDRVALVRYARRERRLARATTSVIFVMYPFPLDRTSSGRDRGAKMRLVSRRHNNNPCKYI